MIGRVALVTFHINPQCGPLRACPGEPQYDARTVGKPNASALVFADTAINRVFIAEVIGKLDRIFPKLLTGQTGHLTFDKGHDAFRFGTVHVFIVMPGIIIPPEFLPVFAHNLGDRLFFHRHEI